MRRPSALYDANVLYSEPVRDILMQIAVLDLVSAKWSADIHKEWMEALIRDKPDLKPKRLERIRDRMDSHVRDCVVTGYEELIPKLNLPDSNDRHVLAAAITGGCDLVVTYNLKDFPATELKTYGIEARHPDAFLLDLFSHEPVAVLSAFRTVRARLKKPARTASEYLDVLDHRGLVNTVAEIRHYRTLI